MSSRLLRVSSALLAVALCEAPSRAQILYVDDSAPPGGDGSSWALAIRDLGLALTVASHSSVSQVWVAEGRYLPSATDPAASFVLPDGIPVYGGFDGTETSLDQRDPALHTTLLDGDLNGDDQPGCVGNADNSWHVVRDSGGSRAHLDGCTVRGGQRGPGAGLALNAAEVTLARLTLEQNCAPNSAGGGAFLRSERAEVRNCTFRDNNVFDGAGAGIFFLSPQEVLVSGCRFERQQGTGGTLTIEGVNAGNIEVLDSSFLEGIITEGGGILVDVPSFASCLVERCTFERNDATTGGGLSANSPSGALFVRSCSFLGNKATTGGAVQLDSLGNGLFAEMAGCTFAGNRACTGSAIFTNTPLEVQRCDFSNNNPPAACGLGAGGGGIRVHDAQVTVSNSSFSRSTNSLLWADTAAELHVSSSTLWNGGGTVPSIRLAGGSHAVLDNSIAWGGATSQVQADASSTVLATYSDVRMGGTGLPGTGNFEADPLFRSQGMDDLRLQPGSPCIDAGDPALLIAGPDAGQYSRLTDGNLDGVTRIDMGGHEASPIDLAVTGTPAPGSTLVFETSGQPGLATFLSIDRPGLHFFPSAGTLFQALTGGFLGDWPPAPSSVPVTVPPGIAGLFHAQAIVLDGGAIAFSNFVPLSF